MDRLRYVDCGAQDVHDVAAVLAAGVGHAVGDEGDAVRDIVTVIGQRLMLPVEAVPQETFGPLGPIFATDQPSSKHPSLLEDLENIQP